MFADDTQLLNKNEEFVEQSFGAAGHPCLAERDIAKNFDMKPFVFIQVFPFLNNI
jgi:hypothetical protein